MEKRIHGVIGGPRVKTKVRPKKVQNVQPIINEVDVVIIPSDEMDFIEEVDPVLEEDKSFTFNEILAELDARICSICGFKARSGRGLKGHRRLKHPIEVS